MGWKSTIDVTREEAISCICYRIEEGDVGIELNGDINELNDEDLASLLEEVQGGENHGYNYRIVDHPPTISS